MLYSKPEDLLSALAALAAGAKPLAGGTDLMVGLGGERPWPGALVDLKALPELHVLEHDGTGLRIGAGVPLAELLAGDTLADFPALRSAIETFAARQIRERATLGGNIANASPAADTLPPLIAYGAVCRTDRRELAAEAVCTGPGSTCLEPGELLLEITVPGPPAGAISFYHKLAPRDAMAIAIVGVAGCLEFKGGVVTSARIALGAVAPVVLRARNAEAKLVGRALDRASVSAAAAAAMAECSPIDDLRASATYRRRMVGRIVEYQLSLAMSSR